MDAWAIFTRCIPVLETVLLLLISLCSGAHGANRRKHPPYDINTTPHNHHRHSHGEGRYHSNIHLQAIEDSIPRPLEHSNDFLIVTWVNSSVHEISISWNLSDKYNTTGFIRESLVEYLTDDGRFTSHPLNSDVRNYTFVDLNPGHLYTICVYVSESYVADNYSTIRHSRCLKINTIEFVRRDSVVVCLATVGYYALMAFIGYAQWRRRCWTISNNAKMKSRTSLSGTPDGDCRNTSECRNTTMRWKDLAERETLMTCEPGRSIESNNT